jgi:hypothetical protein
LEHSVFDGCSEHSDGFSLEPSVFDG